MFSSTLVTPDSISTMQRNDSGLPRFLYMTEQLILGEVNFDSPEFGVVRELFKGILDDDEILQKFNCLDCNRGPDLILSTDFESFRYSPDADLGSVLMYRPTFMIRVSGNGGDLEVTIVDYRSEKNKRDWLFFGERIRGERNPFSAMIARVRDDYPKRSERSTGEITFKV